MLGSLSRREQENRSRKIVKLGFLSKEVSLASKLEEHLIALANRRKN